MVWFVVFWESYGHAVATEHGATIANIGHVYFLSS
jgi:hypothetical protein